MSCPSRLPAARIWLLLNRIWCGALEERLEHVLTDLGSENPSQHAQLVLAVVAGLEVNHMGDAGTSFY